MNTAPFIAVEGPIGAGKTTLASMLSVKLSLSLVKEIVEENPFLDKFYDEKDEWSFQLEIGSFSREKLISLCNLHNAGKPNMGVQINGLNETIRTVMEGYGCGFDLYDDLPDDDGAGRLAAECVFNP